MTDREFIIWLAVNIQDKRSDISDLCYAHLDHGKLPDATDIEHRYIQAKIPNTEIEIEYDTLSTLLSYHMPTEQWKECQGHIYRED